MTCNNPQIIKMGTLSALRQGIKQLTEDGYPNLNSLRAAVGVLPKCKAISNGNKKMPGYTYGASAWFCKTGSKLWHIVNSACYHCYAKKNKYTIDNVKKSKDMKSYAIEYYNDKGDFTPWIIALTQIIKRRCTIKEIKDKQGNIIMTKDNSWFRWHDSGDIQSVLHLEAINQIALNCPDVKFWIPTREGKMVKQFLKNNEVASNLCIRISGHIIGKKASDFGTGLPTSSIDYKASEHHCIAPKQDGACDGHLASCRNCWDPSIPNVNYYLH